MQRKTKNTDYSETKREEKEEAKIAATLKIVYLQMEGKRQVKSMCNERDKDIKKFWEGFPIQLIRKKCYILFIQKIIIIKILKDSNKTKTECNI